MSTCALVEVNMEVISKPSTLMSEEPCGTQSDFCVLHAFAARMVARGARGCTCVIEKRRRKVKVKGREK